MKGNEIRKKFLQFFEEKGHQVEPSASLVPVDDPTLLWINSGVATLKRYFDGSLIPENPRITNCQKSIRTNDIENVGKTARHLTFFEMLGNFSVGDYFKEESILWAWEFLTDPKWIGFDPERLSVTIHPEDDEAFAIWHQKVGIPKERIVRLEGNFWDIGEGPCGPNSEIFYDKGESFGNDPDDPELFPGGENARYLEVWNLVFSQYNHNPDGTYTPLPKKNIDTGMGLERMASVLQQVETNFETDLLKGIIEAAERICGMSYKATPAATVAYNVIADHVRTITFAIVDGALPSNEGRGYIIRRLLRRAVRYGKVLGLNRAFLYQLVPAVGEMMGDFYPEVQEKRELAQRVIRSEEERFHETLSEGLQILSQMVEEAKGEGRRQISGKEAFLLYDTFGFPLDLTEDYAVEVDMTVDREGFDAAMEIQRERARAARQEMESMKVQGGVLAELPPSEFVGYDLFSVQTQVTAIVENDQFTDLAPEGSVVQILLERTPFYAESGGQVADLGVLVNDRVEVLIQDVQKGPKGQHIHRGKVTKGTLRKGERIEARIEEKMRKDTIKNHTATHLLHKALKEVLGDHVNQAGSLVAPERLRFDFSHFGAILQEELQEIETRVNQQIWHNTAVQITQKKLQEAKAMGAMALFGEKYGEEVRVVQVGDYSLELCGGCHVGNTAEIGLFKIVSESGIGSGVRRIEAMTGRAAFQFFEERLDALQEAANLLKGSPLEVPQKLQALQGSMKQLLRENESLKAKIGHSQVVELLQQAEEVGGGKLLAAQVQAADAEQLRQMADDARNRLGESVILLGSAAEGKVQLVCTVSPELVKRGFHAGNLIKEAAGICGGGGGGRPQMAQAGGKLPEKLPEALQLAKESMLRQARS